MCGTCFLKHCNGDCPTPPNTRKLLKDVDLDEMVNTSYMCPTVLNVLAEEDRIAEKKAKEPIKMCRECRGCNEPILKGFLGKIGNCNKITSDQKDWFKDLKLWQTPKS